MTKENEILEAAHDAALEKPFEFKVTINPKNKWHKLLMCLKIKPKVLTLTIKPTVLGARLMFSKFMIGVELSKEDSENMSVTLNNNATIAYTEKLASAIASIIHNKSGEPPRYLIDLVLDNFSSSNLRNIIEVTRKHNNPVDFLYSIILASGVSLHKKEEIIAPLTTIGKP